MEVNHLTPNVRYAIALTEKEKELLRQLGKITHHEIMDAEVNDMPPRYRLACQCFVRNEDIQVCFEGDTTLPVKGPALSIAAAVYTGGIRFEALEDFLGHAIQVEADAAVHYDTLAAAMETSGNQDVAELFRQLGRYSTMHLEEARAKCSRNNVEPTLPAASAWPDNVAPERTGLWAGDLALARLDALKAALQGERRGFEFYYAVAGTAVNPQVRDVAREFVKEETEHVETLKRWIMIEESALRSRSAGGSPVAPAQG